MSEDEGVADEPEGDGAEWASSRIEQTSGLGTLATLRRGLELSPEIRQGIGLTIALAVVATVGKVLRRYSIDELPQLINVIKGDMSLVGPRPPLRREVEKYGYDMHRRFLVKPGLTGLWQVSGRSDLSWDDSVRIDVRYVENWSLAFDFMILWKTVGAVVRGRGAY